MGSGWHQLLDSSSPHLHVHVSPDARNSMTSSNGTLSSASVLRPCWRGSKELQSALDARQTIWTHLSTLWTTLPPNRSTWMRSSTRWSRPRSPFNHCLADDVVVSSLSAFPILPDRMSALYMMHDSHSITGFGPSSCLHTTNILCGQSAPMAY